MIHCIFLFKPKTAYEMRISDCSADVCSSDLAMGDAPGVSLKKLSHRTDGTLTTTLAAPRVEDINQVLLALQARGYRITAQPMAGSDGQQMANITIRAVP